MCNRRHHLNCDSVQRDYVTILGQIQLIVYVSVCHM